MGRTATIRFSAHSRATKGLTWATTRSEHAFLSARARPLMRAIPSYMILAGTAQSAPGAAAAYIGNTFTDTTNTLRKAESAIVRAAVCVCRRHHALTIHSQWRVNTTSGAVTAAWVNDDASVVPHVYIGYVDSGRVRELRASAANHDRRRLRGLREQECVRGNVERPCRVGGARLCC
jgi:hypothetical protein